MSDRKLIKCFPFEPGERARLEIPAEMTLVNGRLELKANASTGLYSTAADLKAKTWVTNPDRARAWEIFFAQVTHRTSFNNTIVTTVGFRLSNDGVAELWWNGAAWVVAAAGEWNTEAEVNTNLSTFPFNQRIQFIVNISTSDATQTPAVDMLSLLYCSDISFQEDYIRSFIRGLKTIRPRALFALDSDGTTAVSLAVLETPYQITGVVDAFNDTADPFHQTNIAGAYDTGTETLTLTAAPAVGDRMLVRFEYAPVVALMTSADFTELSAIPAIVLDDVKFGEQWKLQRRGVINKATHSGFVLDDGYQVDIDIPLRLATDKSVDQQLLSDAVNNYFAENQFLVSLGSDERFRLRTFQDYDAQGFPSNDGGHFGRIRARIVGAVFYHRSATPIHGVTSLKITGGNLNLTV